MAGRAGQNGAGQRAGHGGRAGLCRSVREFSTMSITTNRRSFLFGASVAGFGILAPGRRGWAGGVGPNETLNIACIGVGGKGASDTDQAAHHGRIVALCDIDQKRLDDKGEKHKDAKKYSDFRKLLDELGPRLDAVVVSTPDHTHASRPP